MKYYALWMLFVLLVIAASMALSGCADQSEIHCHHWSQKEKDAIQASDKKLSPDDALHGPIRDYERVCSLVK